MSIRASFRSTLLALCAALTACGARGAAPPAAAPAAPAPTAEAKVESAPAAERRPYVAEGVPLVASVSAEKDERLGYEMKLRYPQLAGAGTPQARGFNRLVRRTVGGYVEGFKAACAEDAKRRHAPYELEIDYDVMCATKGLVSVKLTAVSFTGYLNSDWSTSVFNYDLKAGRELELEDLFRPRSKFLEAVAGYCVEELLRRGVGCGGGTDEHWLREGARPLPENYSDWNLTAAGIEFTYGEYQIGPGCVGLVDVVVPYERLRDILRPGVLPAELLAGRH